MARPPPRPPLSPQVCRTPCLWPFLPLQVLLLFCAGLCVFRAGKATVGGQGFCGDHLPFGGCPRFPDEPRGLRAAPWQPTGTFWKVRASHAFEASGLDLPFLHAHWPTPFDSGLHLSGAYFELHCPLTLMTVISQKEVAFGVLLRAWAREDRAF